MRRISSSHDVDDYDDDDDDDYDDDDKLMMKMHRVFVTGWAQVCR